MHWDPAEGFFGHAGWLAIALAVFVGILVLRWLVQALVCWLIYRAGSAVPEEQREIDPALVFLLLIPFLDLFLNFLVQPCIARSFRRWFESKGDNSEGDCGENLAWWYAITSVASVVPCFCPLSAPAAIALQVVFVMRLGRLRRKALALR